VRKESKHQNSYEMFCNSVLRKKTDAIPVAPYMGNHGAVVAGVKLIDYYNKGEVCAQAQYKAWELYGHDAVCVQSDNYYIAEGFGTKSTHYENSTPTFLAPAIESLEYVGRLKVPDPDHDGRMHVYIEAASLLRNKLKGKVIIRSPGTGPFSLAGHILGIEKLLMEIAFIEYGIENAREKELHALMELATQALVQFSNKMAEAGADVVVCGDSLASLDMISPEIYKKYVFPYESKYFEQMRPIMKEKSGFSLLHVCGNNDRVVDLYGETGADIIEVDYKSNLQLWKQRIGHKVTLMGNIDPTGILLQGSVEDVRNACLECIRIAASGGGFILGSGCEVPPEAPMENLREMIRVGHSFIL
jgi:uroporphyrinogen decarboxylase